MVLRPATVPKGGYRLRWPRWIDEFGRVMIRALIIFAARALILLFRRKAEEDEEEVENGEYEYEYGQSWDEGDTQEWGGEFKTGEFDTGWDEDLRGYDFLTTTRDDLAYLPRRGQRRSLIPSPAPPPMSTLGSLTSTRTRDYASPPPPSVRRLPPISPAPPPPMATPITATTTRSPRGSNTFSHLKMSDVPVPMLPVLPILPAPHVSGTPLPRKRPEKKSRPKPAFKVAETRHGGQTAEQKPTISVSQLSALKWISFWRVLAIALVLLLFWIVGEREERFRYAEEAQSGDSWSRSRSSAERVRYHEYGIV
ncbi:hypothetical protein HOY80DRAFT_978089 [Tuber brumale]|nr:hypothetical protein HOY80DRAFT_978089 [Tuber brumale]